MNKFLIALTAAAAAAVCSSSQAAIVAQVTPVTISTAGFAGAYTGYKITMTTDSGGVIGGVDFSGARAFQLPLHQRWTSTFDPDTELTTNSPTPVGTTVAGTDSHLIYNPAVVAVGSAAVEDNSGLGSPATPAAGFYFGMGTTMGGAWAYTPAAGATASMDVAYLVIANASLPANGILATPVVTEVVGGNVIPAVPVIVAVPEPASLGFVVLAGAGLIARRRKA